MLGTPPAFVLSQDQTLQFNSDLFSSFVTSLKVTAHFLRKNHSLAPFFVTLIQSDSGSRARLLRPSLPCLRTPAFTFVLPHGRFALDRFAILFSKSRSSDRSLRSSCLGELRCPVLCTSQRAKPLYTTRLPALSSASGSLNCGGPGSRCLGRRLL